jgi:hypothetical protein
MAAAAEVVELERVRCSPIHERGLRRRESLAFAPHNGRTDTPITCRLYRAQDNASDVGARPCDPGRECIDEESFRKPHGFRRQVIVVRSRPVLREALGESRVVSHRAHSTVSPIALTSF